MSELIKRMSHRVISDMQRGVPFSEGTKHFIALLNETVVEINKKLEKIEEIEKRMDERYSKYR